MRLSDHLLTAVGSESDIGGIFTKTCAAIQQAERFELSDDVARAGYNLTKSRPSSLLTAMPMCRAPYPKIWLEWRGGLTTGMVDPKHKRDPSWAPDPLRQGVLIETDKSGQRGTMTFAWVHKDRPERAGDDFYTPANVSPLGTLFNWAEEGDVHVDGRALLDRRYQGAQLGSAGPVLDHILYRLHSRDMSDDELKGWMERSIFEKWGRFANIQSERDALQSLGRHAMPWVPENTLGFFSWVAKQAMASEKQLRSFMSHILRESWQADIEGEPPFADTIIAMINSRNAVEHRDVDLSGLNRSRVKRGRPAFLPYRTTHLRLSQAQMRAFRAGLLSKEDAGRHRVRGHFKIRRTGVYWWSPFFRGDPAKQVQRQEYIVQ